MPYISAIVGYPACAKDPERAIEINQTAVEKLANWLKPQQKLVIFFNIIYKGTIKKFVILKKIQKAIFPDNLLAEPPPPLPG